MTLRARIWVFLLRCWLHVRSWFRPAPITAETHYRMFALRNNATGEKLLTPDGNVALWPKWGDAMKCRRPGETVVPVAVPKDKVEVKNPGKRKLSGTRRIKPRRR